ncbi:hypothetical protein [Catenulispora sp. MAP12-49]|uniref:hypothetical protein n=1 Tax=Catenulispora sp. MAP12-49 TaxID=3156302 RepID=UPI0035158808
MPARTSTQTWHAIIALLAPEQGDARSALSAVTGACSAIISEEYTRDAPIVVRPATGPQIRIYTVHGPDVPEALESETPLTVPSLTGREWTMSVPCGVDDIDDFRRALSRHPWISLRDLTTPVETGKFMEPAQGSLIVNLEELR